MRSQLAALIDQNADALANTANFLASIFSSIDAINRVGFYIRWGEELTPGTFRGLPACTRLPVGTGSFDTPDAANQGHARFSVTPGLRHAVALRNCRTVFCRR